MLFTDETNHKVKDKDLTPPLFDPTIADNSSDSVSRRALYK
jgi:hypothetical protein